ncbi:protein-disulfide oxidoreductase DsbI [Campylobacter geochelonis]|uniref:protein-disulfide oxidoreductase DsbI n=1 Tax=Campylobacter geochelonis TaxID=1780362 RepID=UPI000770AA0A|nr:protein-disulfide oxidoreductase DsbI [Campylobacter geochelonis]CZE51246.1 putative disulfide oxidoreductase [Campylobacter geochelonis]
MSLCQDFKSAPLQTISRWQDQRFLWIVMAVAMFGMVILAHSFFQNYLYMLPCEQCVYIRFSMLVMALGGIIAAINPKNIVLKIIGYVLGIYGAIIGIGYSVKLHAIHEAVHGDDPFGVQGCSTDPNFPFGLPLAQWSPDWFKPTGDCGYDSPIVPDGAELDAIQTFFTNFYSEGWYLIPSIKFGDMAQCTLLAYVVSLALLVAMLSSWIITKVKSK